MLIPPWRRNWPMTLSNRRSRQVSYPPILGGGAAPRLEGRDSLGVRARARRQCFVGDASVHHRKRNALQLQNDRPFRPADCERRSGREAIAESVDNLVKLVKLHCVVDESDFS